MQERILPIDWQPALPMMTNAKGYVNNKGLRVIVSFEMHAGQKWQHVSVSRKTKLPTWQDIRTVKDIFIGRNEKAIMILPADAEYVNVHPYCMHMYCNLQYDPLPDFTRGLGII